jgi:arylsulfatase
MTGKHPGHAYIRSNRRATLPPELKERLGMEFDGQEPIPDSEVTIAELLKPKGYATGAFGKWGLGHFGTSGDPNRQGFDLFFGYNCQGHAHSYYPGYLWRNANKVPLQNDPPVPGHADFPAGADPEDPASYAPFKGRDYAPDHMIEEALAFIQKNRERPFFLYFPSTIPHVALHIPDDELKPYLGRWEETPFLRADYGYTPHQTPRAAYAAMISRLDKDVGRIMKELERLGLDENTLVMFSSDNGTTHLEQEVDYEFFESVGPLRGLKGSLYEGGIRVPMIARWPGKIKASTTTDHPSAFQDVLPTLAEVAGVEVPEGIDGISFLTTLLGEPGKQQKHAYLYWEFPGYGGQQAVRMGDWKAVRQNMLRDDNPEPLETQLYNLESDIGESKNVADDYPEVVKQLERIMANARIPSEVFPMPPLDQSDR